MKAAISTDGNQVSAHFGRCPVFTLVEIEAGKLKSRESIPNPGHQTGFLPRFLHEYGVECIVAGGMGRRAVDLFEEFGIHPVVGVTGSVDDVIQGLIDNTLKSGESLCQPRSGKGYGVEKADADHSHHHE